MKVVKIISAVWTFAITLPCVITTWLYCAQIGMFRDNLLENRFDVEASTIYSFNIYRVERATAWLIVIVLFFFIAAGVLALVLQKKRFAGFVSGGLILATFLYFAICELKITTVENHPLISAITTAANIDEVSNGNFLLFCILVVFPMLGFFATAIIETIRHKKNIAAVSDGVCVANDECTTAIREVECSNEVISADSQNIDDIKKFKKLLDEGIITPEEFDAKKKQLLGL